MNLLSSQWSDTLLNLWSFIAPFKEVIQPHLPVGLPCYDFTPVTIPTLGAPLLAVKVIILGVSSFHSVTGGVNKIWERIHRCILTSDY